MPIKIPVIIIFRNLYLYKFLSLLFSLSYTYTNSCHYYFHYLIPIQIPGCYITSFYFLCCHLVSSIPKSGNFDSIKKFEDNFGLDYEVQLEF